LPLVIENLPWLDIQKPNLAAAVEFLEGGPSRAVKSIVFAPSPLQKKSQLKPGRYPETESYGCNGISAGGAGKYNGLCALPTSKKSQAKLGE
jgi:hypothetical protein